LSILAAIARVGASRVDHQLGRLHREVAEALVDVHQRADEVHTDLISRSNAKDVSLELLAFLERPRIGALINRDDELGDGTQDLEGLGLCGFHGWPSNASTRDACSSLDCAMQCSDLRI
jgi:hypothetical protein